MSDATQQHNGPVLPRGFETLEPFVGWSLGTETERIGKRQGSSMPEIIAFKDAMLAELKHIFDHMEGKSLDALETSDQRLLFLTLSLAEVSPSVEAYRQIKVVDGFEASRFLPVEELRIRPKI